MLNVLIVEDNYEDMLYCETLLKQTGISMNIIKSGTGNKAMDILLKSNVDVAFIDINLPDYNGLTLASEIRSIPQYALLNIVFITVEVDGQLEAYKKFHCYDYIVKPFKSEDFYDSISFLFTGLQKLQNENKNQKKDVIVVQNKYNQYIIEKSKILFIKSNGRTVDLYLEDEIITDIRMKISAFIELMNDPLFIRCHKSFAVNIREVDIIENRKNYTWDIKFKNNNDYVCYMSRTFYNDVKSVLKNME